MRFLKKQTCQKLIELGCKSDGNFYSWSDVKNNEPHLFPEDTPIFTLCDFLDTTEQAIQNCKILIQDGNNWTLSKIEQFRHSIIDSIDPIAFIEEYVSKL